MREDRNETGIIRRLTSKIVGVLRACKEDSLLRPRAAVRLNPFPSHVVQRASPEAQALKAQFGVGYFDRDAANVFVGKEIVAGELQVVQSALRVEEEGIASPARKEAVVAGVGVTVYAIGYLGMSAPRVEREIYRGFALSTLRFAGA